MEGRTNGAAGVDGTANGRLAEHRQRWIPPSCYQMLCYGRNGLGADGTDATIAKIRTLSEPQAKASGISGVLAFSGAQYVQLLEGPRDSVETMFNVLQSIAGQGDTTHIVNRVVGYPECWDWTVVNLAPASIASYLLSIALAAALDGSSEHIARLTWFMVGFECMEQGAGFGARLLAQHQRVMASPV